MDVLFIVPYVPNRIRIRPYSLIQFLSQAGHRIHLATLWQSEAEKADLRSLEQYCARIAANRLSRLRSYTNSLLALSTRRPLQADFCWEPRLMDKVRAWLDTYSFDVVHVEHLRGARYGLAVKEHLRRLDKSTPVVWDSVDCISFLFTQAAQYSRSLKGKALGAFELGRTRRFEGELLSQFDQVLVTSRLDKDALIALSRDPQPAPVTVLPNGVDLDYFSPGPEKRQSDTIVFSGKMSYHANITAVLYLVREILPLVWKQRSSVQLQIVGKDPAPEVLDLQTRYPGRIEVTGTVADIRPYLRRAAVSVVPIVYGAGIQNKVLEAMACATPVVSLSTAVSALDCEPGRDLLVAVNERSFADHILTLLADESLRCRIGQAGLAYVSNRHDWHRIIADLASLYAIPARL